MTATSRLAAFAVVVAAVTGGGALAGAALDSKDRPAAPAADHGDTAREHTDAGGHADEGGHAPAAGGPARPVRGLAVAEKGLRLVVTDRERVARRTAPLDLRIVGRRGTTIRDFEVEHERRLHLIVVRRDMAGFQHLHPRQRPDGSWTLPLTLREPGSYRVFADFVHDGTAYTLATDLHVDGRADLRRLPAPAETADAGDGYTVDLAAARARPGKEATLRFAVRRGGTSVHPEPYLGAGGHLVALREGDQAFLHVHPTDAGGAGGHDDSIRFAATFPTAGRYRLFLQFKDAGRVRTAEFTQAVR